MTLSYWINLINSNSFSVFCLSTGALAALLVGHLPVRWAVWGELALCVLSLLMTVCVFVMDTIRNIWLCYSSYVVFRATYMLLITVAT